LAKPNSPTSRAAYDASICGKCGEPIAPGAPVWRAQCPRAMGYKMVAPVCAACAEDVRWWKQYPNLPYPRPARPTPRPCLGCGRPMYQDQERAVLGVYCSRRCRWESANRQLGERRAAARPRQCTVCGKDFTPPRNDARTCSPACRQRAYRARPRGERTTPGPKPGSKPKRGQHEIP
jgi:hypothetical protein